MRERNASNALGSNSNIFVAKGEELHSLPSCGSALQLG